MRLTIAMAAIAASPNGFAAKFTQVTATDPTPLRSSDGSPPPIISRMSSMSGWNHRGDSRTTPTLTHITVRIVKLMVWQIAVAKPAPKMPRPAPKISAGARAMFRIAPVTRPIIE